MSDAFQQSTLNKSRSDKFIMVFNIPPALRSINKHVLRSTNTIQKDSIQFSIFGTVVPELTVPAIELRYSGSTLYNSSHARNPYPPLNVDFTVDSQYNNYWVIYQWLNLLHDQKTGLFDNRNLIEDSAFKDYQTDISVFGLDEFNKRKIEFIYTKAFPTTLGDIKYNYREADEITSSFTFVFSQLHTKLLE
jgi:hypothetical protein